MEGIILTVILSTKVERKGVDLRTKNFIPANRAPGAIVSSDALTPADTA